MRSDSDSTLVAVRATASDWSAAPEATRSFVSSSAERSRTNWAAFWWNSSRRSASERLTPVPPAPGFNIRSLDSPGPVIAAQNCRAARSASLCSACDRLARSRTSRRCASQASISAEPIDGNGGSSPCPLSKSS